MKLIVLSVLLAGCAFVSTGCATPAHSPRERSAMINRTWRYEGRQAVDDWDTFWLLRPPSRLTKWNVR
ncbi:MAG TPA: hypothetical protein VFB66_00160 [Tepidisphaeraceae bacterium]|nr:hypothetical protein [Tepidisphaeraceae bacterium]